MPNINEKKLFEFKKLRDDISLYECLNKSYESKKKKSDLKTTKNQLEELKKRINSLCFKEYLKYKGLHPKINCKILEIGEAGSLLAEELLSEGFDVTVLAHYKDQDSLNLELENHVYGELTINGIKKEIGNSEYNIFSGSTKSNRKFEYNPNIYDFNTIICEDNYMVIPTIMSYNTFNYVGFCGDLNTDETRKKIKYYINVIERLNSIYRSRFSLTGDEDTSIGKGFYLVNRRL